MTGQPKRIEKEIVGETERATGKLFLRVGQALRSGTPVDIGFARSGWTPSTGSPKSDPLKPPTGLPRQTQKQLAAKRLATSKAAAALIAKTYRLGLGKAYWVNGVVYIVPLNSGSSSQAPKNFVEKAISDAVNSVRL